MKNEGSKNKEDQNASLSIKSLNIALKPNKDVQGQRNDEKALDTHFQK